MTLQKGHKTGNRLSATNQPKRNGRKPSHVKQLVKALHIDDATQDISTEDIYKLMGYLLVATKSKIEIMLRHPDLPFLIVNQIRAMVMDFQNGKTDTVDKILDRLYGKAQQKTELTGAGGSQLIPDRPMSRKDYEKLLNDLKCGQ
jgi:hypothetical protein